MLWSVSTDSEVRLGWSSSPLCWVMQGLWVNIWIPPTKFGQNFCSISQHSEGETAEQLRKYYKVDLTTLHHTVSSAPPVQIELGNLEALTTLSSKHTELRSFVQTPQLRAALQSQHAAQSWAAAVETVQRNVACLLLTLQQLPKHMCV